MATTNATIDNVKSKTRQAVDNIWVERLVRLGYAMRGVLYLTIGVIAIQVALGNRGAPKGPTGAIQELGGQPYGPFLLALMAIGLAAYSFWGFIRAIWDPLNKGHDTKGMIQRIGFLWSGLSYGVLVLPTVQYLQGKSSSSQTAQTQDLTARLMHASYGVGLIELLSLVIIGVGIGQVYVAYKRDFMKDLARSKMSAQERKMMERLGQMGYAARGVVFALVGFFLMQAALTYDPGKAQGLDGALLKLAQQPYGLVLLGLVALGLICFGVYSILAARVARV